MAMIITPLTLYASVTQILDYDTWDNSDGEGDPWIGQTYQWQVNLSVAAQNTSDWTKGYTNTEADVVVGDWLIMTNPSPMALQIIGIDSQSGGTLNCIVEDIDRFNLHNTQISGIGSTSTQDPSPVYDALIVRLAEDGLPVWDSIIPFSIPVTVQEEINSRFRFRNYLQNNYRTFQDENTFEVGDELSLGGDGLYTKASAQGLGAYKVIGRVRDINIPTDGWFTFQPNGKLVRYLSPNLPGNSGDVIYLDPANAGKLTATRPTSGIAVPLFIKIDDTTGVKVAGIISGGLDNFSATAAPTANDDAGDGYSYGSLWIDRTNKTAYINVYPNAGQSIWQKIGGDVPVASDIVLGSVKIGENINVTTEGVISVTKGAGINKIGDIPDVYTYGVTSGSLLVYNSGAQRWDAQPSLSNISLDGGEF